MGKKKFEDAHKKPLLKMLEDLEADEMAVEFIFPVDYVRFGLLDYPEVIKRPMAIKDVQTNV